MNIAIIGSGNVGGTLASKWATAGHQIHLGVRDLQHFKGQHLLSNPAIRALAIQDAVALSEVILLATPASYAIDVAKSLGDTSGKVILDSMNIVMGRGTAGYSNTADAILANTQTNFVAKCFNVTGFNNMADPNYGSEKLDMFTCGDSSVAKEVARKLSLDAGFAECYDCGGNDRFQLLEQYAFFWINLAMIQGQGREIGFKLLKR